MRKMNAGEWLYYENMGERKATFLPKLIFHINLQVPTLLWLPAALMDFKHPSHFMQSANNAGEQ